MLLALSLMVLAFPIRALSQLNIEDVGSTSADVQEKDETESDSYLVANNYLSNQLYEDWQKRKEDQERLLKASVNSRLGYDPCSCVSFVKFVTGYKEPVGNARNWPKVLLLPFVGGVVITNESPAGHVAVITQVDFDNETITIVETNYKPCKKGTRTLSMNSPKILGYWKQ